jgi:hypothetical protein
MLQTDDCVILVQGHKIPTSVFSFIKFSNCCRNTNLDYTFQTKSYYFTIICSKVRKGPNTVNERDSIDEGDLKSASGQRTSGFTHLVEMTKVADSGLTNSLEKIH